jgi:hypothetical protein
VIWDGAAASTQLSFLYARGRDNDSIIAALLEAVAEVWQPQAALRAVHPIRKS